MLNIYIFAGTGYPPQQQAGAFVAPPPPAGYPTRDVQADSSATLTTQSRGDGFWKGWLVFFSFENFNPLSS